MSGIRVDVTYNHIVSPLIPMSDILELSLEEVSDKYLLERDEIVLARYKLLSGDYKIKYHDFNKDYYFQVSISSDELE